MSAPRFVVVGHPNKGKSSIVATLAQDERVRVSPEPGTTTAADTFPLKLDGRTLYTLVDTPGFQRARAALRWMQDHEANADQHPAIVRRFVEEPQHAEKFPDEVALLRPLVDNDDTGVLYVVDGSTPYGPEYEPEMEILRWAGRPRMALINPIGPANHVDAWRDALGQYFGVVRVFNAVTAEWQKRIELLEAFGQLNEAWQKPVREAIDALETDRDDRRRRAAQIVSHAVVAAMRFRVEKKLEEYANPDEHREALEKQYRQGLRDLERDAMDRVEEVYDFVDLRRQETDEGSHHNELGDALGDLFASGTWNRFGLTRQQLALMGAGASALLGAGADVAAHGLSFGVFTLSGAVAGGLGGWWGGGKLPKAKLLGLPMGGRLAAVGPSRNVNLAFVLLGRARLHHRVIAQRTHARRDAVELPASGLTWDDALRKRVAEALRPVLKHPEDDAVAADTRVRLEPILIDVLRSDTRDAGS